MLDELAKAGRALGLTEAPVLVAVSGGVDSTVLLEGLCELRLGGPLVVGHVNHGLRGAASDEDEAFVARLAAERGLPFRVGRVAPRAALEGGSSRTRPTLQEAARRARYGALMEMAAEREGTRIATAHTLDDQAETVLLRLLRGAGPSGLGGIPERSADGRVVRPLLGVPRAAIERFARERGLSWREDASNRDARFARARLRHEWMPGLAAAFNPRLLNAVADLAEAQQRDTEWIEAQVDEEARRRFRRTEDGTLSLSRSDWGAVPDALARRLARRLLHEIDASRDVSRTHLLRVVEFLRTPRTGRTLELPGGARLVCERGQFRLLAVPGSSPPGC